MIYIAILISIIYSALILAFIIGFKNINVFKNRYLVSKNTFSIVIAFRNEAKNLPTLLQSLSKLYYPTNLFEILLINDNSTDEFESIITGFTKLYPQLNISLYKNKIETSSPKKDAITIGIKQSKFEWIVTTDADCIIPTNWIQLFNQFIEEKQALFISAPVKFKSKPSFLFHFQNLNFISLIGSAVGGFGIKKPFMCNGANLCYKKQLFIELDGFLGNETIVSGDDIFLLEKMIEKYPERVHFLKSEEATVLTQSEPTWKQFMHQQIRWASKSSSYTNVFSKFIGITILSENLLILITTIFTIFNPIYWKVLLFILIQKLIIDFILLLKTAQFFKQFNSLGYFPLISLLYPFYILIISFLSMFKKYEWKGRLFNK